MADRRPAFRVTLNRFFLSPDALEADRVIFPAEQSHQIRRVLRLQAGDRVVVLDGTGAELIVRLDTVQSTAAGTVEERRWNRAEPHTRVVLYQGLLKGAKLEMVLQKCTEIGVAGFVPVVTARSVPSDMSAAKQRRYEVIIREAAEQSRRGVLPALSPVMSFGDAVQRAAADGSVILPFEGSEAVGLREIRRSSGEKTIGLFVGPEGGFSDDEVELVRGVGARIVTLGPRILRAETAAIVSAALVLAQMGELG